MEEASIFTEKANRPTEAELKKALGKTYLLWKKVCNLVYAKVPDAITEWNFPGVKYGWSFRIKNKKRVIIYFLPGPGLFRVAFVFWNRAYQEIMLSTVSPGIKTSLSAAKIYAEGRGIRIDVTGKEILGDISRLVDFKLAF
jgi:hypothetical protein